MWASAGGDGGAGVPAGGGSKGWCRGARAWGCGGGAVRASGVGGRGGEGERRWGGAQISLRKRWSAVPTKCLKG